MNANIRRSKKNGAHPSMGDADTTKHEFMTNIRRDSAASTVGHKDSFNGEFETRVDHNHRIWISLCL